MKTTVNYTTDVTAGYGDAAAGAVVRFVAPFYASNVITSSAANSPLYRTYCSLYEEVKVVGMKVAMAVVSAIGGSDVPSLQIYTAWDRKHGMGEPPLTAQEIKDSATYAVATCLNNNVAKLTRSIYASDLIEKATWIDASLDSTNGNRNAAWNAAGLNPTMFCPGLFWFLNCPSLGAGKNITVSVSVTYYFAFRNPRFGGASSSAKLENLGPRSVFPDGGGDVDGDDGDMIEHEDLDAGSPPDMIDDEEPPPAAEAAAVPSKRNSAAVVVSPTKKSRPLNK